MTGKSAISILLISAFATSGCSTLGRASIEKVAAYGDNRPDIGTENVALYVEQQNKTIDSLSRLISGDGNWKPVEKDNKQDWTPLVQAGIQYVDVSAIWTPCFGSTGLARLPVARSTIPEQAWARA